MCNSVRWTLVRGGRCECSLELGSPARPATSTRRAGPAYVFGGGIEQEPKRHWPRKKQEGNHQEQAVANPGSSVRTAGQAVMQVLRSALAVGVAISPGPQLPADTGIGCRYDREQVAQCEARQNSSNGGTKSAMASISSFMRAQEYLQGWRTLAHRRARPTTRYSAQPLQRTPPNYPRRLTPEVHTPLLRQDQPVDAGARRHNRARAHRVRFSASVWHRLRMALRYFG